MEFTDASTWSELITESMAPLRVTVRFWAGARRAAGRSQEVLQVTGLADLRAQLAARSALSAVMAVASILVDGQAACENDRLSDGSVVDVLPPFAGGSDDVRGS